MIEKQELPSMLEDWAFEQPPNILTTKLLKIRPGECDGLRSLI